MYNHILVPMALDHGYGPQAMELAQKLRNDGGQITALHDYEKPQGMVTAYVDDGVVDQGFAAASEKLAARVADQSNTQAQTIMGHSGRTIIDYAAEMGVDCIIMGSHKPGLIDFLLGSTAARVVRHAPCAVHVLRLDV